MPPQAVIVVQPGQAREFSLSGKALYSGSYHEGEATASITSTPPRFLRVPVQASVTGHGPKQEYGPLGGVYEYGIARVTGHAYADSNAVPGKYRVEGVWRWKDEEERFRLYVKVIK